MSSDLNMKRLLADEYEIQHFGFSSTDFIAQFRSTIINTIKSIHQDMAKCIVVKLSLNDEQGQVLHSEIINLQQRYIDILTESLKNSEEDIRNFFTIPKHVILDNDKVHLQVTTKNDLSCLQNEIDDLEKEYLREKMLIAIYKQELDMFAKIEPYQQHLKTLFTRIGKCSGILEDVKVIDKLNESCNRIMEQVQECSANMKSKVTSMCAKDEFKKTSEMVPLLL